MNAMKQFSLAETGFLPKAGKQTRIAVFLSEMETVVPWFRLEALIEPFYPKRQLPSADAVGHDAAYSLHASLQDSMLLKMRCPTKARSLVSAISLNSTNWRLPSLPRSMRY